jgi:Tfp pilus assembly protein PilO
MQKQNNNKSSVLSLVLILVLILSGIFWMKPNWDEVSALNVTLQNRETEKKGLEDDLQKLQTAQTSIDQGSEINKEIVLAAIPEKFQQDQLITQITGIAKKYDVNMSSISFSIPVNSAEQLKTATISVSMTGSEGDLLRFLKGLESNARKLVVKNVTVQFGSSGDLQRVNFNITLETFYQGGL